MRILKNIFVLLFFVNILPVNAIDFSISNSKISNCSGANINKIYYISNGTNSYTRGVADTFWSSSDVYIGTTSKVSLWTSDSSLVSGCNKASAWNRYSEVAPGNNIEVIALGANCIYNKPTNKDNRFIQFVFNIKYAAITTNGTDTVSKAYTIYDGNWKTNYKTYNKYKVGRPIYTHDNECLNIELRYCGDGIVSNGEACDPEDPNHIGWGAGGCDNSCNPINTSSTTCDGITVNPNLGKAPLSSQVTCNATNASSYKIDCGNGQSINSSTGTCNYTTEGTYAVKCIVDGNITSAQCQSQVVVSNTGSYCGDGNIDPGEQCDDGNNISGDGCSATCELEGTSDNVCGDGNIDSGEQCDDGNNISGDGCSATCQLESTSGGGGGGIGPICYDIKGSYPSYTCLGNSQTKSFKLDCGNGVYPTKPASTNSNGLKQATFGDSDCKYSETETVCNTYIGSDGNEHTTCHEEIKYPKTSEPRCYVSGLSWSSIPEPKENYSGWSTRNQCQYTIGQTCGNGILEGSEECEKDASGNWPNVCNTNCTLKNPGEVSTIPGYTPGVMTIPNHGNIVFGERANVIIYKGQSVGEKVPTPYIKNDSDYDLNLKSICVVQTSGDTLTRPAIQPNCKTLPTILYPGQRVSFPGAYDEYIGKEVPEGQDYGDNELKITYQNHAGQIFDWAYFAETVKVRVAKPSIMTIGGGTSFVKDTRNISDINKVADGIIDSTKVDDNKNFVGTSVSSLDSLAEKTTDSNIIDKVEITGSGYENNIKEFSTTAATSPSSIIVTLNDRETYNGMKNVYIFKNKSLRVDDENILNSLFSGPITFIIENGNLYIDKNIVYNDNVAFVVKGGDIIIKDSVTRIDGTYITIRKGTNGGKFISTGETAETLVINGAIYGNIDDLVSKRVNFENNNGNLSVGTVVSFGSALFKKPAPLVSQFIEEYLEQQKVAQ